MQPPAFRAVTVRQEARRGPSAFTRITDRANPEQARVGQRAATVCRRPGTNVVLGRIGVRIDFKTRF